MCGCDGGAVVVVKGVCVVVMVVQWLWWRRVCSYEGGEVVVVEGVCSFDGSVVVVVESVQL